MPGLTLCAHPPRVAGVQRGRAGGPTPQSEHKDARGATRTDAIEHAQKAADLEPKSAEYQALLALAFDWSGNSDRALVSARRATELDAKLADGWAYLAEADTDKFKLADATDALERANNAGG